MSERLPLPALLSRALVAFVIEFDNEAEHRMPHRTTLYGDTAEGRHAPWLVSMAMWANCIRFVTGEGRTIGEIEELASTRTNWAGMQRWGYVTVDGGSVVRATAAGLTAQAVWRPLGAEIEGRWREQFGGKAMEELRESLAEVVGRLDPALPDCLPILEYGLFSRGRAPGRGAAKLEGCVEPARLPVATLLSRTLLAFAMEFEGAAGVSLAIGANVLRLAADGGVRVKDLPETSGVSKEAIAAAVSYLEKRGYARVSAGRKAGRSRVLELTAKGTAARERYFALLAEMEEGWRKRFGESAMGRLRAALERLDESQLMAGLEPYPDGWRARAPRRAHFPHYPMVLHRGGFPDGS